ncbi:MAG: hypothetical protein ACFCD0_25920 [Gemmataceae bacterium]
MIVADLIQFVKNISDVLEPNGAKKVAEELNFVCERLDSFRNYRLKEFGIFLTKADAYAKGELSPKKASSKKASSAGTKQPDQVQDERTETAIKTAQELLNNATDPETTYEMIDQEIRKFEDLSMSNLKKIASAIGVKKTGRSRANALDAIIRRIKDVKAADERSRV